MKTKVKKEIKKSKKMSAVKLRKKCPMCGSEKLLTAGVDQFCLTCDWDTCLESVNRGLMDNIQVACLKHFPADTKIKPKKGKNRKSGEKSFTKTK